MTTRKTFDLQNLAVHALWFVWAGFMLTQFMELGWAMRLVLLLAGLAVNFWNYAVLHNHMHVSIARPIDALVSRTLSLAVGFAYRGFYLHHFNHHKYNNGPGDWGRFYYGQSVLLYSMRSTMEAWLPFGPLTRKLFAAAKNTRERLELVGDLVLVNGLLIALAVWQPVLGASWFVMLLVGQTGIFYINYAAHQHADGEGRGRLAMTSTSRFYNTVFFNAGYHQAHHHRPQTPWYALAGLTETMRTQGLVHADLTTTESLTTIAWIWRMHVRKATLGKWSPSASRASLPTPLVATSTVEAAPISGPTAH